MHHSHPHLRLSSTKKLTFDWGFSCCNGIQENAISSVKLAKKYLQFFCHQLLSKLLSDQSAKFMTEVGSLYQKDKTKWKASHFEACIVCCHGIGERIDAWRKRNSTTSKFILWAKRRLKFTPQNISASSSKNNSCFFSFYCQDCKGSI